MRFFLLLASLLPFVAKADFNPLNPVAIVGGDPVSSRSAVATSLVEIRILPKSLCTGTMVGDVTVLTAAHCLDLNKEGMVVTFRPTNRRDCGSAKVVETTFEPNSIVQNGRRYPDLALLRLERPLCGIVPARLRDDAVQPGETVQMAGLGVGTPNGASLPNEILLTVVAPELSVMEKIVDGAEDDDRSRQQAARGLLFMLREAFHGGLPVEGQAGTCFGDSGGPTYQTADSALSLVGVTGAFYANKTKGSTQCQFSYLQLFTPVAPYANWIRGQARAWSQR